MSNRTIHALLVGINEYPPPVTALHGCLYDVDAWEKQLKSESEDFTLNIHTLRNSEVTKQALVKALIDLLSQSDKGDIAFFFYSGHGTRETADPVFSDIEQDNALESLVCHDSIKFNRGNFQYNLLSDKEVHYILSKYGKDGVHILTVFDCCHSGGITRNMFLGEKNGHALERRHTPTERLSFVAPMRKWHEFIFADQLKREQVEAEGWMKAVPQKRHLTLSACQNDESAFELDGKGIFTVNMIDVLERSGGALSYYDLQSRVRLFTQNQFRQTPEVYAIRGHENDLLSTFLDKADAEKTFGCTCFYKTDSWTIDLGALHGVSPYSGPVEIVDQDKKITATIDKVFANYSTIVVPQSAGLIQVQGYRATLKSHFAGGTTFHCDLEADPQGILAGIKNEIEISSAKQASPFSFADQRNNAGYVLKTEDQKIRICHNDDGVRPVTEVLLSDPDASGKVLHCMRHIAQWEYIRTLSNPEYQGTAYPLDFKLYRVAGSGTKREFEVINDVAEFDFDMDAKGMATGRIKLSLSNAAQTKYYCALLYLSNEFQIGSLFDSKVIGLNPGETAWILHGAELELFLEKHVVDFNYPHSIFYLKLFANTDPFQVEIMEQSALPAPVKSSSRGIDDATARGLKTRQDEAVPKVEWFTRTICFKGRNPHYKAPASAIL